MTASAAVAQLESTLIAFVSDRDGNNEIYVIAPDGAGLTNLTLNGGNDESPSWSPDGTKIAFASNRDASIRDIFVMDADGANPQNLTSNAADNDWDPAWSPDGTQIAFRSNRAPIGLYVMDEDGSNVAPLLTGVEVVYPAWSPDGSKIAYESDAGDGPEISVLDIATMVVTRLTTAAVSPVAGAPAWSPDGSTIAFHSRQNGSEDVWTMNAADGSGRVPLTGSGDGGRLPAWSSDGTELAFATYRDNRWAVYVMDADGANQTRVTAHASNNDFPAWSPSAVPFAAITAPMANDVLPVGTTSVDVTIALVNHATPGTWAWQLDTPFPASGPSEGNEVVAGTTTTTVPGLSDSQTYTLYVALVDGAGDLLSPSVTDSVTFSVDGPPTLSITSPTEGEQFAVGTTEVALAVNLGNHPSPGHWHWQLDTPFAGSGQAGGFDVAAGTSTDTITGLVDGTAYTVYVALVDGSHALLSPSVTASATFTVGSLTDTLTVVDKQRGAGTTVTIPVDIYDVSALNVVAVDLIVTYDDTILTPTSEASVTTAVAPGPVVPAGWSVQQNVTAPGSLVVSMASDFASTLTGAGTLLTLDFDVAVGAAANTTTPIGLTGVELNEGAVSATAIGGTFTVLSIVYGDVTGNGSVGAYDAAWMLEYVVNAAIDPPEVVDFPIETTAPVWAPLPLTKEEALEVADVVTPDGLVTASDAADVLRFRVGLIGSLNPGAAPSPGAPAFAPVARLSASSTSVRPGAWVTVSLDASATPDLRAGEIVLHFDSAVLRPVDVSLRQGDTADAAWRPVLAQHEVDGQIAIAFASARPLEGLGGILDVTFEASRSISRPTESAITASHVRLNRSLVDTGFVYAFRVEPFQTRLMANYPNPFNPETWIPFELAEDARVALRIYDISGTVVRTLDLGQRPMGEHVDRAHAAYWDGRNQSGEPVASGVYVYELTAAEHGAVRREVRRMVVAK